MLPSAPSEAGSSPPPLVAGPVPRSPARIRPPRQRPTAGLWEELRVGPPLDGHPVKPRGVRRRPTACDRKRRPPRARSGRTPAGPPRPPGRGRTRVAAPSRPSQAALGFSAGRYPLLGQRFSLAWILGRTGPGTRSGHRVTANGGLYIGPRANLGGQRGQYRRPRRPGAAQEARWVSSWARASASAARSAREAERASAARARALARGSAGPTRRWPGSCSPGPRGRAAGGQGGPAGPPKLDLKMITPGHEVCGRAARSG